MDRKKVIKALETCKTGHLHRKADKYVVSLDVRFVNTILELLKEQPNIVRCKECKYWDYRTEGCMHLTGRIAPIVKTGADWYCCDGERKDT